MKTRLNDSRRALRLYAIAVSALTLILILLRCLNLFFFFDKEIGYYTSHAVLPVVEAVLLGLSAVLMAVGAILLFRRVPVSYETLPSPILRVASVAAAALTVLFTVLRVLTADNTALLPRLLLVLSVVAAAYFLLHGGKEAVPPLPRLITGLAVILWLLLALASAYFDVTVQMNTPDKLLFQLGCLSGMIFTVSELRLLISEPRSALYTFSLGAAVLFGGVSSIPTLIAGLSGALEKPSWFFCSIPLAGMFLYALVRMFRLQTVTPEEAPETEEPVESTAPSEESAEKTDPLS